MNTLRTVVVVHETDAPDVRRLLALYDEHVALIKRARWAGVDEVVGFTSVMECEACDLMEHPQVEVKCTDPSRAGRRSHLRPVPTRG